MHHDSRPRKRMTVFLRTTSGNGSKDKLPSGGEVKQPPQPVGEMVGGVWVGK